MAIRSLKTQTMIEPELYEKLKAAAKAEERTVSDFIRLLILEGLEERGLDGD